MLVRSSPVSCQAIEIFCIEWQLDCKGGLGHCICTQCLLQWVVLRDQDGFCGRINGNAKVTLSTTYDKVVTLMSFFFVLLFYASLVIPESFHHCVDGTIQHNALWLQIIWCHLFSSTYKKCHTRRSFVSNSFSFCCNNILHIIPPMMNLSFAIITYTQKKSSGYWWIIVKMSKKKKVC